jgi:AraC-like DNA-binding protein
MSQTGQIALYVNEDLVRLEALPVPVVAYARDLAAGERIPRHSHRRAQLVHASTGVMTVTTASGAFVVPPHRAVWMPAGVGHRIDAHGQVAMRTVYVATSVAAPLPPEVCVLQVTALLRELILAAVAAPTDYAPASATDRLMAVLLDQITALPVAPLALPMPRERRLARIVEALMADPADRRTLDDWARVSGASARTLARLFRAETGMTFGHWRQQRRLLRALELLATGRPVTLVAVETGYDSASAFTAMFRRALGTAPGRYFADER